MYLSYYNLKQKPFQISTDPKFLWLGEKHKEALSTLKYGIIDNKGFLLLSGDVGTGKTTLVKALLKILGSDTIVATVQDPALDKLDFFNFIAHAFGLKKEFGTKGTFLVQFGQFLYDSYYKGKKVLLIIDEAQRVQQDILEEIRMLSNIERDDAKLLNIFFVGQNEFNNILLLPENRAIRQRITVNYNINSLTKKETAEYIQHRLKVAKATNNMFHADAIHEIYSFSKGYPRLINIICDRALLTGFVEESKKISARIIKECAAELKIKHYADQTVDETRKTASKENSISTKKKKFFQGQGGGVHGESRKSDGSISIRLSIRAALMIVCLLFAFVGVGYYFVFLKENVANSVKSSVEDINAGKAVSQLPTITTGKQVVNKNSLLTTEPARFVNEVSVIDPLVPKETNTDSEVSSPESINKKMKDSAPSSAVQSIQKLIIHFDRNSNLPVGEAVDELNELAEQVLQTPDAQVIVRGYTDSSGYEHYNLKLSEFRANNIKGYLVGRGIKAEQITTVGLGSKDPIAPNSVQKGRKANRRVEVEIRN